MRQKVQEERKRGDGRNRCNRRNRWKGREGMEGKCGVDREMGEGLQGKEDRTWKVKRKRWDEAMENRNTRRMEVEGGRKERRNTCALGMP